MEKIVIDRVVVNQRFASKGGQVVHFVGADGSAIVSDTGWRLP